MLSILINLQKGILLKQKGNKELAVKSFTDIVKKDNSDNIFETKSEAYYQLGEILKEENRQEAIKNFEKAYVISKENANNTQKLKIIKRLSELALPEQRQ